MATLTNKIILTDYLKKNVFDLLYKQNQLFKKYFVYFIQNIIL